MSHRSAFFCFIGSLCFALILGFLSGRVTAIMAKIPNEPLVLTKDERQLVPVVTIDDIHNGVMNGTTNGHVRVFGEGEMVVPDASGNFHISLSALRRTVMITVPPDAQFVASKNGKKYYKIDSPAGNRLKPETRRYFATAAEAEAAGFTQK